MSENKELNIYQKLSKITEELGFVKKNLNVKLPNGTYKAVGEVDVLEAVKPLETKYGVYSYPFKREISVDKETTTKSGTTNQYIRVDTTYRFINVDKPQEFIDIQTYGDGVDSGDKAPGKAMTYADKYALLKAYKISTGDDPDQNPSEEQKTTKNNKKETNKSTTKNDVDKIKLEKVEEIKSLYDLETLETIIDYYKVKGLLELNNEQMDQVIKRGKEKKSKKSLDDL
ncbi:MAG: ERF family protein [Acholeplasmataceae bacterium]